jgi:hypothetical protein
VRPPCLPLAGLAVPGPPAGYITGVARLASTAWRSYHQTSIGLAMKIEE